MYNFNRNHAIPFQLDETTIKKIFQDALGKEIFNYENDKKEKKILEGNTLKNSMKTKRYKTKKVKKIHKGITRNDTNINTFAIKTSLNQNNIEKFWEKRNVYWR